MHHLAQSTAQKPDVQSSPAAYGRWRILALLMAFAGLVHFNRISMSVAGTEHIMKEYDISETRMGLVYSAYLIVYTLCMIPGGWLIDRFGPKMALLFLGLGSAILVPATGLTHLAPAGSILLLLCLIRALLGVVSTPMHPGAARALSFWFPPRTSHLANGLVTGTAVIGIASTYFVFGLLMDQVGWPAAFLVSGGVTLLLTIVWAFTVRDHPGPDRPGQQVRTGEKVTFGGLLSMLENPQLLLLALSYAAYSYFQYLFFYWMQYYFDTVLQLGKEDGRLYATIPTLAMAVGMVSGGWLADHMRSRLPGWAGRAFTPMCSMTASAVLLVLGILSSQPVWVVTCFALALAALGASEAPFWVTGIELGKERGGLSAAFLNTVGNAGGLLAPILTPLFSTVFGWQAGLGLASVICLLGAVLWWWIVPEEDTAVHTH